MAQEESGLLGMCKVWVLSSIPLRKGAGDCANLEPGCTGAWLAQEPFGMSLARDTKAGSNQAYRVKLPHPSLLDRGQRLEFGANSGIYLRQLRASD